MMDSEQKKVSIILHTYNGVKYLAQSIKSCLEQTYKNLELIIVNDGSVPELDPEKVVKQFADARIHYLKLSQNQGVAKAINIGFKNSTGQYLTWTSDDNYYAPQAIEEMVNYLERNSEIDFVCTNFWVIDENEKVLRLFKAEPSDNMDIHNTVGACFLLNRKIWEEVGEYKTEWKLVEDYEYWLRVREKFKIQNFNKNLYYYRVHLNSLRSQNKLADIEELARRASWKYISKPAKLYRLARVNLYKGEHFAPIKYILQAIFLQPEKLAYWKLLALSVINLFSPKTAMKIRERI